MNLCTAIDAFVEVLRNERAASPHTIALYRRTLVDFAEYTDPGVLVRRLDRQRVGRFLVHLRDARGNSPASLRAKLAAIRAFLSHLLDARLIRRAILDPRDFHVRLPRKIVVVLTRDELDSFLDHIPTSPVESRRPTRGRAAGLDPTLRDRAILFLLAGCGLRVNEAVGIDLQHVDQQRAAIRITGKGGDEREIYYDVPPLREYLDAWIDVRRQLDTLGDAAFLNFREGGRLSTRAVQILVKRVALAAGLRKKITPHTFRHTYATLSIENGANAKAVAQILGHRTVRTTINTYTHLSETHVRDVFRACHPMGDEQLTLDQRIEGRKQSLPLVS